MLKKAVDLAEDLGKTDKLGEYLGKDFVEKALVGPKKNLSDTLFGLKPPTSSLDDPYFKAYERKAGEAEARNAAERAKMSLAERFKSSPESTEDIPREDQWTKPNFSKGGTVSVDKQMKSFYNEGGLEDDGMEIDPVSGNEVPPGSMAKEVRDDVDAKLSDGEYVIPADVVRFFGVSYFEKLRDRAKKGLAQMDKDGRIGGEPMEDDEEGEEEEELPFTDDELMEAMSTSEGPVVGMAEGGLTEGPVFQSPVSYGGFQASVPGGAASSQIGTQSRAYMDPQGNRRFILFINGKPVTDIPSGFVPDTPENRANLNKAKPVEASTELTRDDRTDKDVPFEATGDGKKSGPASWTKKVDLSTPESAVNWGKSTLDTSFGEKAAQLGAGLLGSALGPLGSFVGKEGVSGYQEINSIAEVRAAAEVAKAQGRDDVAEALNTQAEQAYADLSRSGKRIDSLSNIEKMTQNKVNQLMESVGLSAPTKTASATTPTARTSSSSGDRQQTGTAPGTYQGPTQSGGAGWTVSAPSRSGDSGGGGTSLAPTSSPTPQARPDRSPSSSSSSSSGTKSESYSEKMGRGGGFKSGGLVAKRASKKK